MKHRYQKLCSTTLMYGPEGNSSFCFPEDPDIRRGKHQDSRENKTITPRDHIH